MQVDAEEWMYGILGTLFQVQLAACFCNAFVIETDSAISMVQLRERFCCYLL